jgi:hypothetical protein
MVPDGLTPQITGMGALQRSGNLQVHATQNMLIVGFGVPRKKCTECGHAEGINGTQDSPLRPLPTLPSQF